MDFRRSIAVVPLAVLSALLAHQVRFGDDHAMGGEGNEALVGFTVVSLVALACCVLYSLARDVGPSANGSIVAHRLAARLPGHGSTLPMTAAISGVAAVIYFGIEALERGSGTLDSLSELLVPLTILAIVAFAISLVVRALFRALATLGVAFACLAAILFRALAGTVRLSEVRLGRPLQAGRYRCERRFGRAPPPH